jgi:hypothetical protein
VCSLAVVNDACTSDVERALTIGVAAGADSARLNNADGVLNRRVMEQQRGPVNAMRVNWLSERVGPMGNMRVGGGRAQAHDISC